MCGRFDVPIDWTDALYLPILTGRARLTTVAIDLLVCFATDIEGALLKERLTERESLAMVRTGVGPVNAAHAVTLFLARETVGGIMVCGVGGAYPSSGLEVGDVACAETECYGDLGATSRERFLDMEALEFPVVE